MPLPKIPKGFGRRRLGKFRCGEEVGSEEELIDLLSRHDAGADTRLKEVWPLILAGLVRWEAPPVDGMFFPDLPHVVRSKWEANFARWLIHHDIAYYYEAAHIRSPRGSSYFPDFWIRPSGLWVEVKGLWHPGAKRKVTTFLDDFPSQRLLVLDREYYSMLTPVGGWSK